MIGTKDLVAKGAPLTDTEVRRGQAIEAELAAYIQKLNRRLCTVTNGLSADRKLKAGYRNPDPATGREPEHTALPGGVDKLRDDLEYADSLVHRLRDFFQTHNSLV